MTRSLDRGAVVSVRFDPAIGSEIRKTRPAVVVSNDAACRYDAVVQVVPVTRLPGRELRPYEAEVGSSGSGLAKPSRLVANQIRTISKKRIGEVIGEIDEKEQRALDSALAIQLGLRR
jgi:mRNA interferase MazF